MNGYSCITGGILLAVRHKRADMDCCEEHIVHMDAVETARRQMPDDDITTAASDFSRRFLIKHACVF